MRYKVELRPEVVRFLRRDVSPEVRREFYEQLGRVVENPVEHSECLVDPELSRYALRFFRFGPNMAIFELDAFRSAIMVRQCRGLKR